MNYSSLISTVGFLLVASLLSSCVGMGSYEGKSLQGVGDDAPKLSQSPESKRILIIGGTAGVGLEVVKLSLARGHTVTAVARRPERMTLTHPSLTTLKGDITVLKSMQAIIPHHQIIISTIGIAPTAKKVTLFSDGIKNVLQVMDNQDIKRLLTVTAIGAGDSKGHGGFFFDVLLKPLVLSTDIDDKTLQEDIIKRSSTNWTIIRPGFLTNKEGNRQYRVIENLSGIEAGEVTRNDIAHFIIASFENNLYSKKTVLLTQ